MALTGTILVFFLASSLIVRRIKSDKIAIDEVCSNFIDDEPIEYEMHQNHTKFKYKREVDPTFKGHPKTREEMWHQSFRIESLGVQAVSAEKLVVLLNKVVTKYLRACVSVVIYDQYVEQTDSVILQTFFQV